MADSKQPSSVGVVGSITRSQARKRRIADGQEKVQEEENDKGFRFTRQSKRVRQRKQGEKKTTGTQNETTADKEADKEKKKRRSSFIRGRKIQSPLDICQSKGLATVQDLYKEISSDLSPDERLLQLFDKSLLLMCTNCKDKKYTSIPNFSERVEEFVSHLRTNLKNSDFAKRATEQKNEVNERILIPNPKIQQLEEYAQTSRNITERMTKEDQAWEEVLDRYQNETASTEREIMETYSNLDRECLSEEQTESLDSIRSKTDILESLDRLKKESILVIDKITTTAETVKALNDAAKDYLDKTTEELIESPTPMNECATPRHLFHAITKDSEKLS